MVSGVGKGFCAGGDIMALYKGGRGLPGADRNVCSRFPKYEYLLDYTLATMEST